MVTEEKKEKNKKHSKKMKSYHADRKAAKEKATETVRVRFENLLDPGVDVPLFYRCEHFIYNQHGKPGEVYDIPREAYEYFKKITTVDFESEDSNDGQTKIINKVYRPRFSFSNP